MPRLASRVLRHLGHGDSWDGTPSELAASGVEAGFSPEGLSRAIFAPKVSVSLASAGVTVARGYRGKSEFYEWSAGEVNQTDGSLVRTPVRYTGKGAVTNLTRCRLDASTRNQAHVPRWLSQPYSPCLLEDRFGIAITTS